MKEIYPEGTKFIYLTKTDELPAKGTEMLGLKIEGVPPYEHWERVKSNGLTDIRLAVMAFPIAPHQGYVYCLHWDDNTDLDLLDHRVTLNQYNDEDFMNSVKSQIQITKCFECGWEGLTLVMPTGDPYPNSPKLAKTKEERRYRRGGFIFTCPTCNTSLRQGVVKIFRT